MNHAQARNEDLLGQTEAELFRTGLRLRFKPALEERYQCERNAIRNRHCAVAGFLALLIYEVIALGFILKGEVRPGLLLEYMIIIHLVVSLPAVVLSALGYFNLLKPTSRELMVSAIYIALCCLPALYNNFIVPEKVIGIFFGDVLVIIACNIALPLSFRYAAAATTIGTALLSLSVFYNLDVNQSVAVALVETYVATAAFTLLANYRAESADRRNYLHALRESVHTTLMHEKNTQLEELSLTDPLTGLANRRKFDRQIEHAVNSARETDTPLAMLSIDIDHFKLYNDHYGHPAGDACLISVAQCLGKFSNSETLARLGGEEFALLLPDTDAIQAANVAELLRREVQAMALPHDGRNDHAFVTISIGVAVAETENTRNAEWLMRNADDALYVGKRSGRNQVSTHRAA